MDIYADLILFSLIILIYWIITELFTVLFRFTGLPDEKARFQVISLLTGTGFTTRESEMFLSNRSRRRLARITMLFGYVFNVTVVSAIINVFLSLKFNQAEHVFAGLLIPMGAITVIFLFMRFPTIRSWGDGLMMRFVDRIVGRSVGFNTVVLLDYIGSETIAQVTVNHIPEAYRNVPLSETGLKAETGILVMLVERPGQEARPAGADTVFQPGDKLTVFGKYAAICKAFHARERFSDA